MNPNTNVGGSTLRDKRAQVKGSKADSLEYQLWDIWSTTSARLPDSDAVVSMWQPPWSIGCFDQDLSLLQEEPGYARLSYKELHFESSRLAKWLELLGCSPGMKVVAMLWNSAEWALLLWAAMKLNMVFVPVDPRDVNDVSSLLGRIDAHVLVVQDNGIAEKLNGLGLTSEVNKVQFLGPEVETWLKIGNIPTDTPGLKQRICEHDSYLSEIKSSDQVAMMVLTSGTTGDPKICQHTHRNLMSQSCEYDPKPNDSMERWLVHTPVSHIFAINNTMRAWKEGGTVVFPAKSFEVESTLKALIEERCTIMSATPTLIRSLLSHSSFTGRKDMHLDMVTIGGTMITQEDVRLCRERLGTRAAIQAYGMTEGAPLISWKRNDELLQDGYHPGVGRVLPGAAARICQPGSQEVLTVGEIGELHISGSSVVSGYYGDSESPSFYEDDGTRWFMTGDQGMIDENEVVHLLGRYKDLIIRGGENIHPAKIEKALSEIPGLQVAVLGVQDPLAGQVPVAIVKLPADVDKASVAQKALLLGPIYALGGIYTLEELGLEAFPLTALGKVRKGLLTDAATKYRDLGRSGNDDATEISYEALVASLIDAWEQATAIRPRRDQDISFLADSISMLRFCDLVVRLCGKQVYMRELISHNTVEKQARLLESHQQAAAASPGTSPSALATGNSCNSGARAAFRPSIPISPYTPQSIHGKPKQTLVGKGQQALESLGLVDTSIESILPVRSSLGRFVSGQRPQSYHIAFSFRLPGISRLRVHRAVGQLTKQHPLLRAILLQSNGRFFHAIPTYTNRLMENIAIDVEVNTAQEAVEHTGRLVPRERSSSFMLRATVIKCKEDEVNYLSLAFNHSIMDAIAVVPWSRNLDLLLYDNKFKLPEMTPYALFADLHDQYSNCRISQEAVAFHVKRLRGVSLLDQALWPKQKAPGWMISDDRDSATKLERDSARLSVWNGKWDDVKADFEVPRLSRLVGLPSLTTLTERFGVNPPNFSKAAIVLFNVLQTGSSHALFTSWESSRSWPFVPKWIEEKLPPAMSIDGPTLDWVLNMTKVLKSETVSDYLQRIERDHQEAARYAHAPWSQIAQGLQEEGEIALTASFRQGFVWDVSLLGMMTPKGYLTNFKVLEPVNRHNWADCGLFWNAFMLDPQTMYFIASWDTAQMNNEEMERHCDLLAKIMRALATEENWNQTIGELFTTNTA